jgi:hypothetical protein
MFYRYQCANRSIRRFSCLLQKQISFHSIHFACIKKFIEKQNAQLAEFIDISFEEFDQRLNEFAYLVIGRLNRVEKCDQLFGADQLFVSNSYDDSNQRATIIDQDRSQSVLQT